MSIVANTVNRIKQTQYSKYYTISNNVLLMKDRTADSFITFRSQLKT